MILAAYLAWTVALHMPSGETHYFETTPELCIAAEVDPGSVKLPDGTIAIQEVAVCFPPDPCECGAETDEAGS